MPKETFTVKNNLEEIQTANEKVDAFGEQNGLSPKLLYSVNVSIDEVITNIISYGFDDDGEHDIEIVLSLEDDTLKVTVSDDGKEFNPLEKEDPDITQDLEDREIGGLGIFFVKNFMDELSYSYENGKNILLMKKNTSS